jgi:ABC-type sugar transport system ATPase subunit
MIEKIGIKTPTPKQLVKNLTAATSRKVVLAKWFSRDCDIYIFDEPTRGIDVGAQNRNLPANGTTGKTRRGYHYDLLQLPEVLNMSDRILVMYNGQIVKEFARAEATQEAILSYAIGGGKESAKYAKELLGGEA